MPKILNGTQNVLDILNANGLFDQLWNYIGKDSNKPIPAETITDIINELVTKNEQVGLMANAAQYDKLGQDIASNVSELKQNDAKINKEIILLNSKIQDNRSAIERLPLKTVRSNALEDATTPGIYEIKGVTNSTEGFLFVAMVGSILCQYHLCENVHNNRAIIKFRVLSDKSWTQWQGPSYDDLSNTPTLSQVSKSGKYNDLLNKPIINIDEPISGGLNTAFDNRVETGIYSGIISTGLIKFLLFVSATDDASRVHQTLIANTTSLTIFRTRIKRDGEWTSWEDYGKINLRNGDMIGSLKQVGYDEKNNEIFKNQVYSDGGIALGQDNISGCKGYYIKAINFDEKYIYLSQGTQRPDTIIGDYIENVSNLSYDIGSSFSVIVKDKTNQRNQYHLCATIENIYKNRIKYSDNLPFADIYNEDDVRTNTFFVPSQPELGVINIWTNSYSEGVDNKSTGNSSHAEGRETIAVGDYAHAEGRKTIAGYAAHAEGEATQALGYESHAEGQGSLAKGQNSHAEGMFTKASGKNSHAEGHDTYALDENSHSEGYRTYAYGKNSHTEGLGTLSNRSEQHVQGRWNELMGDEYAHIIGNGTENKRSNAHTVKWNGDAWFAGNVTVGKDNLKLLTEIDIPFTVDEYLPKLGNPISGIGVEKALKTIIKPITYDEIDTAMTSGIYEVSGRTNFSEGEIMIISRNVLPVEDMAQFSQFYFYYDGQVAVRTRTPGQWSSWKFLSSIGKSGTGSAAEIFNYSNNNASGQGSHAEGYATTASGIESHAEGDKTIASGGRAHAEGDSTLAEGWYSHAEGHMTQALGSCAHSEGKGTKAMKDYSHAEGEDTKATGIHSHAEGFGTTAGGNRAHAEGKDTIASGRNSHAEGEECVANGSNSHAEGYGTIATGREQHVEGKYNIEDKNGDYIHIVGNGSGIEPSNAHTLDWSGNAWFAGTVETIGIILTSPNGSKFKLTVDNDGNLSTEKI